MSALSILTLSAFAMSMVLIGIALTHTLICNFNNDKQLCQELIGNIN